MDQKRESLASRRQEIQRELSGLNTRHETETDNTALADLEGALMQELNQVDNQLKLLEDYVNHVRGNSGPIGA